MTPLLPELNHGTTLEPDLLALFTHEILDLDGQQVDPQPTNEADPLLGSDAAILWSTSPPDLDGGDGEEKSGAGCAQDILLTTTVLQSRHLDDNKTGVRLLFLLLECRLKCVMREEKEKGKKRAILGDLEDRRGLHTCYLCYFPPAVYALSQNVAKRSCVMTFPFGCALHS